MGRTLIFDIETHSAKALYSMPSQEFVRLIGYKWQGAKEVTLTTDLEELRDVLRYARWIIGHNIQAFDLPAVFGTDSDEPLQMTMEKRVYDTWVHAGLVNPPPNEYTNRHGKRALADKPERMRSWFGLDEQAHQLGVPGKTHDLGELATEFGDPDLKGKAKKESGYGRIPVDDPRFRDYLIGDVEASEHVAKALLAKGPLNAYALREQEIAARAAVISSNGLRLNQGAAKARVDTLAERRAVILAELVEKYDFPTEGKSPWASTAGKEAIFKALADHGITAKTRRNWQRTDKGALSLGGETLIALTEGTPAEDLGQALAELKGQRSLAQLALDSAHPDGKVHPQITMLQRSGRWSTTEPGLTVWTNNGPGAVEKSYFVADSDDDFLMEFDYSNADAREVAALSGDKKFAVRFQPGQDGHMINAIAAWGEATVATDPEGYRQRAKAPGHGWGYRMGANKMHASTGIPIPECKQFLSGMNKEFSGVAKWQESTTRFAKKHGYVVNDWGRVMRVEPGREFNQPPALLGQSGTREIICDALLKMPIHVLRRVKAQIHDALLLSIPKKNWEQCRDYVLDLMHATHSPKSGGQRIDFPASAGPPGANWFAAIH